MRRSLACAGAALGLVPVAAGCADRTAPAAAPLAGWTPVAHVKAVVDVAGPRGDGSLVVASARRLFLLGRNGKLRPFARGAHGYTSPGGGEPYITTGCGHGGVYVLRLVK